MKCWVKLAFEAARQFHIPNYEGARVAVTSQLNIRQWHHLLKGYQLNRLCEYLEFSFPLSLHYESFKYNAVVDNYASAVVFPHDIQSYLDTEIKQNAMAGPYEEAPFTQLHVSPLMTRPKPDGTRRVIVDLLWPHCQGANSCIPDACFDGMDFELHYPSVDHIVEQIQELGIQALLYKVDLKRVYRNLRTDPRNLSVLGFL